MTRAKGPLDPTELVGRAITGITPARLLPDRVEGGPGVEPPGSGSSYVNSDLVYWHLLHLWIEFEGIGWVYLRLTVQEIELVVDDPDPGGKAGDAPAPLAALVGATVTGVMLLHWRPPGDWGRPAHEVHECGHILETTRGSVAIADVGDDYAVGEWPDRERWAALDVVTEVDTRVPRRR